jgi:hypothetical protein
VTNTITNNTGGVIGCTTSLAGLPQMVSTRFRKKSC